MSTSLLLHALSLNDRILEPNQLPVSGHVWGYDKEHTSREEFVGNCISMLSLLHIQDAEINWDDDIMAFDVTRKGQPATVIISLQDDSLTSDYFYFLGIWIRPQSAAQSELELMSDLISWQEEDLLQPAMSYSVRFAAEPLQLSEIRKMIGGEVFAQRLYGDGLYLCGMTEAYPIPSGKFVICPASHMQNFVRHEIRHALYSLRNLMGLMSSVMNIYDSMAENSTATELCQQLLEIMAVVERESPEPLQWDQLVRRNGAIALRIASQGNQSRKLQARLKGIRRLFDVILAELDVHEMQGLPSLANRMLTPFDHVQDTIDEFEEMLMQAEKQTQILQPLMHSRMLAGQQILLEKLMQTVLSDQSE
ncbi:hypothetical protein Ga0123462_1016 [Mariprofundus ferrinatatus]|uniref:Uncharacterized protein n=1 Tax=Mariprofundus ferrinatatus TaxID=1921087 RepID=A0A2K8L3H9_9PROT|nr:hypothetical protein [Mariprofundus ferrinatatus]ATX81885.1 hypothetical protein Ga0123462_1016 [Mariprofundus ferrinatatus]